MRYTLVTSSTGTALCLNRRLLKDGQPAGFTLEGRDLVVAVGETRHRFEVTDARVRLALQVAGQLLVAEPEDTDNDSGTRETTIDRLSPGAEPAPC